MSASLLRNWSKCLVAGILLTVGNLAYAQDVQRRSGAAELDRDRAPRQSSALPDRVPVESRGLVFPFRATGAPVWIEAELRLDGKVIMSEQRIASPDDRAVHLFTHDAGHLGALRDQDARNPGRVQLRILQGGKPVFDSSLTKFDAQHPTGRETSAPRPRRQDIAAKSACSDNCDLYYQDCLSWCDPRGSECANCWYQYENCMASCPTCSDWVQVNRTLIARRFSGTANIIGAQYCDFEEYYLVEETNPAGCYPNRTVCDYDDDRIFYGFGGGHPSESQCCNDDPGDENYCGGDPAPCG